MAIDEFEFVKPIPEDYYERVILHLRSNFFPDEPINKSMDLCIKGQPHVELEKHSYATLKDKLSVMAVHKINRQVIAVALNGILKENDVDEAQAKLECMTDEKFKTIFSVLNKLNKDLNLFKRYDVDEMFECRIMSVDNYYRGKGLAQKLLLLSEQLARDAGFTIIKADSTGLYSQKIFIHLGYSTIFEKNYEDIKDENGQVIFKTSEPHTCIKIMMKVYV